MASTRLCEQGVSLDPSLYAAIARNFSRDWHWWSLKASENLFNPYFEHPFLVEWMQGILFKILGTSDTATRVLGLLTGSLTFYFLYRIGELLVDETFAHVLCFLTLWSVNFTGSIPTLYREVPLTFFMFGAFYFFYQAILYPNWRDEILAGVFLGCAFLTKGFAALPMMGTIGLVGVYSGKLHFYRLRSLWVTLGIPFLMVGIFCALQAHFGSYPFYLLYYKGSFIDRTVNPGLSQGPTAFLKKFWEYHPIPILLAIASLFAWPFFKAIREAVVVGAIATVLFLIAHSLLGFPFRHYYYSLYPIVNLLAAAALYPIAMRWPQIPWVKIALGLALAYQLVWQILPFPMRQKGGVDFFQMKTLMAQFKQQGIQKLDVVGLSLYDWVYRQSSLWEWDVDSNMLNAVSDVKEKVVLLPKTEIPARTVLQKKGYQFCTVSHRYVLYIAQGPLLRFCEESALDPRLLR